MFSFKSPRAKNILLTSLFACLVLASSAKAALPQLDQPVPLPKDSSKSPYTIAQSVDNVFDNKAIFGKSVPPVVGSGTPQVVDIYSLKPEKDGEQQISLLTLKNQEDNLISPILILLDPTDATQAEQIPIPLPDNSYHAAVITPPQSLTQPVYHDSFLHQDYLIQGQQKIKLKKGTTYYLILLEKNQLAGYHYVIKFGEGPSLTAKDLFTHFATVYRVMTDSYAGSSPFSFLLEHFAFLLFMLGVIFFSGIFLVQELWALLANRSKAAGYLLVKLQPFSRIIIWLSLWLILLGGYLYFDKKGWLGIPSVLAPLFIILAIAQLYQTIKVSPRIAQLATTDQKVSIPFALRKRWFFSFLISFFSLGAFLVFLVMYLASK